MWASDDSNDSRMRSDKITPLITTSMSADIDISGMLIRDPSVPPIELSALADSCGVWSYQDSNRTITQIAPSTSADGHRLRSVD